MPITSTGISTGLDVESLVSQLVTAEISRPASRLDSKEANYQAKISAYGNLKAALASFGDAVSGISNKATYEDKSVASSLPLIATLSADKTAAPADYQVAVSSLAKAQTLALAGSALTDTTTAIGTGTLSINDGTSTTDILVNSGNNDLAGLAASINSSIANANATIVNDGGGYRLLISASRSGTSNALTITVSSDSDGNNSDAGGLSRFASANMTQTTAAANASFTVNGLSLSSSSNTVSDAVEGLTFNLKGLSDAGEATRLSVSNNTSGVKLAVENFIKGYNELLTTINSMTEYDSNTSTSSLLTGDTTIRTLVSTLRSLINTSVDQAKGAYSSLADLGITSSSRDGTLQMNSSKLESALLSDPIDVSNVLASIGRSSNPNVEFVSSTGATQAGDYAVSFTPASAGSLTSGAISISNSALNFSAAESNVKFTVNVGGVVSETITLDGDYSGGASDDDDLELLRAALETKINEALPNNTVAVSKDAVSDKLTITSVTAGSNSNISFSDVLRLSAIGLTSGTSSTSGSAAEGTINGKSATYDATERVLTGANGSQVEGLRLKLSGSASGSLGTITYAVGIGARVENTITSLLANDGLLQARMDGLTGRVGDVEKERERLLLGSLALEARYRAQFNGLETLISQMNTTQSFLNQALSTFVEPLATKK